MNKIIHLFKENPLFSNIETKHKIIKRNNSFISPNQEINDHFIDSTHKKDLLDKENINVYFCIPVHQLSKRSLTTIYSAILTGKQKLYEHSTDAIVKVGIIILGRDHDQKSLIFDLSFLDKFSEFIDFGSYENVDLEKMQKFNEKSLFNSQNLIIHCHETDGKMEGGKRYYISLENLIFEFPEILSHCLQKEKVF